MSTHHEHRESADTVDADEVVRAWCSTTPTRTPAPSCEALLAERDTRGDRATGSAACWSSAPPGCAASSAPARTG